LFLQLFAFFWILSAFSNYGIEVDKQIEREKARAESLTKLPRSPKSGPKVEVTLVDG